MPQLNRKENDGTNNWLDKMKLRPLLRTLPGAHARREWLYRRQLASEHQQSMSQFQQEFAAFSEMSRSTRTAQRFDIKWEDRLPFMDDKTAFTEFDRHYIYHPAWAARVLVRTNPTEHVDISSTLHFCSILSAFIPVRFYDYRPAHLRLDNLECAAADLLELPFSDGSINSLSCMHVVEHVGLGRYGDSLDPDGDVKAMRELQRVLAPGGSLLFVVPVGASRICFNAHRIYSLGQVLTQFSDLELREFALIPDYPTPDGLIQNAPEELVDSQIFGCGCFWFVKPL